MKDLFLYILLLYLLYTYRDTKKFILFKILWFYSTFLKLKYDEVFFDVAELNGKTDFFLLLIDIMKLSQFQVIIF